MFFPSAAAQGLLCFLTLIVFASASGVGLLFLLGFPEDKRQRLLLAPIATTMLWALSGDILVRFGFTMAQLALPIWIGSMALALFGGWLMLRDRASLPDRSIALLLAGGALVTVVCAWPPFARGLFNSLGPANMDTFFYSTLAAAYWEHGAAQHNVLPFFEQMGGYLSLGLFRNHTMVLLAFFSNLVEAGEPVFVRNLFIVWSLFTIATSAAYFHRASRAPGSDRAWFTLLYVALVLGMGWAFVPSAAGNWDNGLFIAVMPVLAGLAFERGGWRFAVALGVTAAYAFLTYPELAPVGAVVVAPYFAYRLWTGTDRRMAVVKHYAVAALVSLALIAPAISNLWDYFVRQLDAAVTVEARPGGAFGIELVLAWWNPAAWWALGSEWGLSSVVAGLLVAAVFVGLVRTALKPRQPQIWSLLIVGALLTVFLGIQHYGYGAYKILSVTWWLIALTLLDGGLAIWSTLERPHVQPLVRRGIAAVAVIVLATTFARAAIFRQTYFFPEWIHGLMPTPADLTALRDGARRQPAGTAVIEGQLLKAVSLPWALYALRTTPLRVYLTDKLLPPWPPGFAWTQPGDPDNVLLTSTEGHSGPPILVDTPWFTLTRFVPVRMSHVDNPNGIEPWGTWLGTHPITMQFVVPRVTEVRVDFEAEPGPSRADSQRTLIVSSGTRELTRILVTSRQSVRVPLTLAPGTTTVTLRCEEAPTVDLSPNGEARSLLVAIHGLSVRLVPTER